MGLNVFIVQYPAKVKVSTISRPSASPEQESKTGWPGLLYERLDQLRSEAVGAGKDDDESRSINAGYARNGPGKRCPCRAVSVADFLSASDHPSQTFCQPRSQRFLWVLSAAAQPKTLDACYDQIPCRVQLSYPGTLLRFRNSRLAANGMSRA